MISSLEDPSPEVRHHVILLLLEIGELAHDAVPTLERASDDRDETVREAAREVLRRLGPR